MQKSRTFLKMEITLKKVIVVFLLMTMVEAEDNDDLENYVMNMNERLVLNEQMLMEAKEEFKNELETTCTKLDELEKEVSYLKNVPFYHLCGAHFDSILIAAQTITYTSLLYSSTNTVSGGLDIATGKLSCPHPGTYSVAWSLQAANSPDTPSVEIYLRRNGVLIAESHHVSYFRGHSGKASGRDDGDQGKIIP